MSPAKTPRKRKLKVIRPTVGQNLPQVLGQTLVKDWYAAVSEFVCNSYDADAENVQITAARDRQTLEIVDDGTGMGEEGLESFFRLGDSVKLKEPYSPFKHRKRLGKKGIAKTLLRFLGNSFSLETIYAGQKYVLDEGIVRGRFVPAQVFPVSRGTKSGTKIVVRDLNFRIGENFDVARLYRRLQWDAPNKQDFDIFVNGRLVKKRGIVAYAKTYRVDEDLGEGRRITGRIYCSKIQKEEMEGVFICVNGRAVGDSSFFDLRDIDFRLDNCVWGEIDADFLEPLITLDRTSFQEDPIVDKVIQAVKKELASIAYDLDQGGQRREYYADKRVFPIVQNAIVDAQAQLNSRLGTQYELVLASMSEAGTVARLNPSNNNIYLNVGNKMFSLLSSGRVRTNKISSETYLKRAFMIAAAHAIAKYTRGGNDEEISRLVAEQIEKAFQDSSGIARIAGKFFKGKLLIPVDEIYMNPYRLYDHFEVSNMTGRPTIVIRLLHTSGALEGREDHLFSKESILQVLKPLEGRVSCIEVVDPSYAERDVQKGGHIRIVYENPKPTSLDVALSKVSLDRLGLLNVGKLHPMYFVPIENSGKLRDFVQTHGLYKK